MTQKDMNIPLFFYKYPSRG